MQAESAKSLRLGASLLIYGCVMALGAGVFGVATISAPTQRFSSGLGYLSIVIAATGVLAILEYLRNWHRYNESGITYRPLFYGRKFVPWEQIHQVAYLQNSRTILIWTCSGEVLRIRIVLVGVIEFCKTVLDRVSRDRISDEALDVLDEFATCQGVWAN